MNEPKFKSLGELIESTKGMTRDEAHRLAEAEFGILADWIKVTPDAQKWRRRTGEIARKVDYFGDLKKLLHYMESGGFVLRDDKLFPLLQGALKQWEQNAKPSSTSDAGNRG